MTDLDFMQEALAEARAAYAAGEFPVGAVIVRAGEILGRGRNRTADGSDPTAHAEVLAIRDACRRLGRLKLPDCALYTTLYPCPLCEMAIREVALPRVFYGGSPYRWIREVKFAHAPFAPTGPLLEAECRGLFARKLRELGRDDILGYETAPPGVRRT